jgi:ribosomal protein S18 acetylase RimI-like enzyme
MPEKLTPKKGDDKMTIPYSKQKESMSPLISVISVGPDEIGALDALLLAIEGQEQPQDSQAPTRAAFGLRQALAQYDFLRSDSFWLLLARVGDEPAGYAAVCRIPKADARAGFLFVDELHVLQSFRRRGVGRALLQRVHQLAHELGLAGVRLLVRPENEAARRLYKALGFIENDTIFCEKPMRASGDGSDSRDLEIGG